MLSSNKNKKHPDKNIYLMDKNLITLKSATIIQYTIKGRFMSR